jgi:hypothetical protein
MIPPRLFIGMPRSSMGRLVAFAVIVQGVGR